MTKFILRWIINAIAIFLAIKFVPGIHLESLFSIIWLALIFGLANAFLRPLLKLLTCPLIILTLGLFLLVLNAGMLWITALIVPGFRVHGILPALLGSMILSIVGMIWKAATKKPRKDD